MGLIQIKKKNTKLAQLFLQPLIFALAQDMSLSRSCVLHVTLLKKKPSGWNKNEKGKSKEKHDQVG